MEDIDLRQSVLEELDFDPSLDADGIGVAVENGVVTLTGHVRSYAEKLAVERAVQRVRGVHGIAEEIEIRYPADKKTADDQIAERAVSSINWNAQVPKDAVLVKVERAGSRSPAPSTGSSSASPRSRRLAGCPGWWVSPT
jgi:osmotically-inducible protein OsmY